METNIFIHTMRDMTKILANFSTIIIKLLLFQTIVYYASLELFKTTRNFDLSERA